MRLVFDVKMRDEICNDFRIHTGKLLINSNINVRVSKILVFLNFNKVNYIHSIRPFTFPP